MLRFFSRSPNCDLFELAFHASPIGIALVGVDGSWIKINAAVAGILERSEAEILQHTFQDYTPEDGGLGKDVRLLEECIAGLRNEYRMEKAYLMPDGRKKHVLLSVAIVRKKGEPAFFISQIVPVEDEYQLRLQLKEASRRDAEAAARLQAEVALLRGTGNGRFADEFDTILTSLMPSNE